MQAKNEYLLSLPGGSGIRRVELALWNTTLCCVARVVQPHLLYVRIDPGFAILAPEQLVGVGVADDFFLFAVPLNASAELE